MKKSIIKSLGELPSGATPERKYRWWHAAVVGIVANVASAVPAGYNGDKSYYDSLNSPPGSPPSWAFAPIWAVNNVLTLWSNLRVANLPLGTTGRREALTTEALSWTLFSGFSALYFGLRSPILGALDTLAGLAVTAHSVRSTALVDRAAAWALLPRLAWLVYASYVATGTAIRSRDRLFHWNPRPARGHDQPQSARPSAVGE